MSVLAAGCRQGCRQTACSQSFSTAGEQKLNLKLGADEEIRTPDLLFTKQLLYH